jgi:hypothetical protein
MDICDPKNGVCQFSANPIKLKLLKTNLPSLSSDLRSYKLNPVTFCMNATQRFAVKEQFVRAAH